MAFRGGGGGNTGAPSTSTKPCREEKSYLERLCLCFNTKKQWNLMAYCDGKAKATAMGACNNCSLHAALNCIDLGGRGGGGGVISLKDLF